MKFSTFTIARSDTGAILPLCKVSVYLANGTTLASIYQTDGVTGLLNPLTADNAANIAFAAVNGTYILKPVSADGSYTVPNITVDIFDMTAVVAALAAGITTGIIAKTYATKALMTADLVPADGIFALVYNDSTATNNDLYRKTGATTTGSWSATGLLSSAAAGYATQAAASAVQAANSATAAAASGGNAPASIDLALTIDRNIFDYKRVIDATQMTVYAGSVGSGGVQSVNAGQYLTPMMEVTAGATYKGYPISATRGIYYNAAGQSVAAMTFTVVDTYNMNFTVPGGLGIVAAQIQGDKAYTTFTRLDIHQGTRTLFRSFALANIQDAQAAGSNGARRTLATVADLWRKDGASAQDYTLAMNTGIVTSTPGSSTYVSDYIPVEEGVGLAIALRAYPSGANYVTGSGWSWSDENKAPLSLPGAGGGTSYTYTSNATNTINITAFSGTNTYPTLGMPAQGPDIPANSYFTGLPAGGYGSTGSYTISAACTGSTAGQSGQCGGTVPGVLQKPPPGARFGRIMLVNAALGGTSEDWKEDHIVRDVDFSADLNGRFSGAIGWDDVAGQLPWRSKNLAILGDSLMMPGALSDNPAVGGVQLVQIERSLKAKGVLFGAVGGRRLVEIFGGGNGLTWSRGPTIALTSTDLANVDLLFVQCTSNDWGIWNGSTAWNAYRSGGLGSITDTTPGTFYGDIYNTFVTQLRGTLAYTGKVAWNISMPRFDHGATGNPANNLGLILSQYVDAGLAWVNAYGMRYGISARDGLRNSRVHAYNQAALMLDNLHLNQTGWRQEAPVIANWLNQL